MQEQSAAHKSAAASLLELWGMEHNFWDCLVAIKAYPASLVAQLLSMKQQRLHCMARNSSTSKNLYRGILNNMHGANRRRGASDS